MAAAGATTPVPASPTSYWRWLRNYWHFSVPATVLVAAEILAKLMPDIDLLKYLQRIIPNADTARSWIDFSSCLFNAAILIVIFVLSFRVGSKRRNSLSTFGKLRFGDFWTDWMMFLGLYAIYYLISARLAYPSFQVTHATTAFTLQNKSANAAFGGGFRDTRPGALVANIVENGFSVFVALYLLRASAVLFVSRLPSRETSTVQGPLEMEEDQRHLLNLSGTICNIVALCLLGWITWCGASAFLTLSNQLPDAFGWSLAYDWGHLQVKALWPIDATANYLFAIGFVVLTVRLVTDKKLRPTWEIVALFLCYAAFEVFLVYDNHEIFDAVLRGVSALAKFLMFSWVAWLASTDSFSSFFEAGRPSRNSDAGKTEEQSPLVPEAVT